MTIATLFVATVLVVFVAAFVVLGLAFLIEQRLSVHHRRHAGPRTQRDMPEGSRGAACRR